MQLARSKCWDSPAVGTPARPAWYFAGEEIPQLQSSLRTRKPSVSFAKGVFLGARAVARQSVRDDGLLRSAVAMHYVDQAMESGGDDRVASSRADNKSVVRVEVRREAIVAGGGIESIAEIEESLANGQIIEDPRTVLLEFVGQADRDCSELWSALRSLVHLLPSEELDELVAWISGDNAEKFPLARQTILQSISRRPGLSIASSAALRNAVGSAARDLLRQSPSTARDAALISAFEALVVLGEDIESLITNAGHGRSELFMRQLKRHVHAAIQRKTSTGHGTYGGNSRGTL